MPRIAVYWQCEKLPGTYSQSGLTSGGGLTTFTRLQHNFFYEKTPFNARKSYFECRSGFF